jgi:hypothetical protein
MRRTGGLILTTLALLLAPSTALGQSTCPTEPTFQNYTGGGTTACPCFVQNEQAGAVFDVPAAHYPIEILKVGIGYGSQFGGSPQVLEQAIHIYPAGLPNPGVPIFTLDGPALNDGAINEFDLEPIPGEIIVDSGPFSVTLQFLEDNAGDGFHPTAVHDGNGCQPGKNLIQVDTGAWLDACSLGVSGDWVFSVTYRQVTCAPPNLSGGVPTGEGGSTPLTLEKFGTNLLLSWGASCSANDTQYEIYEGDIGTWYSHGFKLCSTGGATAAVVFPAAGSSYYIAVPASATGEGSYGLTGAGSERPVGAPQCLVQQAGACTP